jgi:hypothetical protein
VGGWAREDQLGELSRRVGNAIEAQFPRERNAGAFMARVYDTTYRGESMLRIHGGAASFGSHIVRERDYARVMPNGYTPDDGTASLVWAASLTALGAHFIFTKYGVATIALDAIQRRLNEGVDVDALIWEAAL